MTSTNGTARLVGVLFFVATASYMTGSGLIDSALNQPEFLSHLNSDRLKVIAGIFLELVNCAAVIGISMLMLPLLKRYNESIAFGYFGSRIIESVLLTVGALGPLMLLALSEETTGSGLEGTYFQTIGNVAVKGQHMAFELAMLALSLGSVLFCYLLFQKNLVPRAMSLLGIIGYIALLASSCLAIAGFNPGFVLFIPGAVFEIIFPLWLIFKGFNTAK